MQLIFDTICVQYGDDIKDCMSPLTFGEKPVSERVRAILEKRVSFFAQGSEVDTRQALSNWRKWTAEQFRPTVH